MVLKSYVLVLRVLESKLLVLRVLELYVRLPKVDPSRIVNRLGHGQSKHELRRVILGQNEITAAVSR